MVRAPAARQEAAPDLARRAPAAAGPVFDGLPFLNGTRINSYHWHDRCRITYQCMTHPSQGGDSP